MVTNISNYKTDIKHWCRGQKVTWVVDKTQHNQQANTPAIGVASTSWLEWDQYEQGGLGAHPQEKFYKIKL